MVYLVFEYLGFLNAYFRLTRPTFNYLLFLISPSLESRIGRIPVSPEKQLLITLFTLGTPDSYRFVIITHVSLIYKI